MNYLTYLTPFANTAYFKQKQRIMGTKFIEMIGYGMAWQLQGDVEGNEV